MTSINEPDLTLDETKARVATEESIKEKIADVSYIPHGQLTICIITMKNGFKVVGRAAPAHPENFDAAVGRCYAFEDAFNQLWTLGGFLLCDQLAGQAAKPTQDKTP